MDGGDAKVAKNKVAKNSPGWSWLVDTQYNVNTADDVE